MNPYATRATPRKPRRNTSGTALPTVPMMPWPLPAMARVGPIRPSESARASHSRSFRLAMSLLGSVGGARVVRRGGGSGGPGEPGERVGVLVCIAGGLVPADGDHGRVQLRAEDGARRVAALEELDAAGRVVGQGDHGPGTGLLRGELRRVDGDGVRQFQPTFDAQGGEAEDQARRQVGVGARANALPLAVGAVRVAVVRQQQADGSLAILDPPAGEGAGPVPRLQSL